MKPQAAMFKSMKVAEKLHPSKALRAFFPGLARRHLAKLSDLPVDILMTILAMFNPLEVLVIRYVSPHHRHRICPDRRSTSDMQGGRASIAPALGLVYITREISAS